MPVRQTGAVQKLELFIIFVAAHTSAALHCCTVAHFCCTSAAPAYVKRTSCERALMQLLCGLPRLHVRKLILSDKAELQITAMTN